MKPDTFELYEVDAIYGPNVYGSYADNFDGPEVVVDVVSAVEKNFDSQHCPIHPQDEQTIGWHLRCDENGYDVPSFTLFFVVLATATGKAWPICEDCAAAFYLAPEDWR